MAKKKLKKTDDSNNVKKSDELKTSEAVPSKDITTDAVNTDDTVSSINDNKAEEKKKKKEKPARNLGNLKAREEKDNKIFIILAFFVPFLIMGVVFIRAKVYPFGDRQIMYSDCKQQYLPFLKEFQKKLQSGDSMFYSWRNGFGTNFMAMIGYYIASPLNLLTYFIPVKYVREAMALFTMIKVGCASMFTAMYLKYVYKRNDLSLVAFGSCYAFCAYMLGYYWNIIWLDSVALLPLVALGVYCIVHEKKYKLYVISLALSFLASYYIGYMICVFVALWLVVLSVSKKFDLVEFCENILKFALYSVIAVALTLPVTMPALMQLQYTVGTSDAFPDKLEIYNNFAELTANALSFVQPTTMEGLPNIATGMICLLMTVVYVRSKEITLREKISHLALIGFLYISLNLNALDYIWHGFHYPNLIPYRFSFIFSFVLIVVAYRAFTSFVQLEKKDIIGMCILTAVMICISVFYLEKKSIIGSLIVASLYIIFMALYEMDMLSRRLLTVFTSLVIVAEMCVQCSVGVQTVGTTNHNNYPDKEEEVMSLVELAEAESPSELFRVELTDSSTKNDGMIYGYNGITQFSSTSYRSLIDFMGDFGAISRRSSYMYQNTSPVFPMFTGLKYVISRDNFIADEPSLELYKSLGEGEPTMYKFKYYLPIGYMTDNKLQKASTSNDTVFITQNKVFSAATGVAKNVYTMLEPQSFDCKNTLHKKEKNGIYSYSADGEEDDRRVSVTYKAPKDGMLYGWANVKSSGSITVVSDTIDHTYDVDGHRFIFPLGYYKKGQTVELMVSPNKSATDKIGVAYFNNDVFEEGYANLADEVLEVTEYTSTLVKGTIEVKKDGTFMTSIPYEKGWKLYVDGTEVEKKEMLSAFIGADLAKGTHEIELRYVPEGFIPGCVLAVLALAGFIGMCVYDARKKKGYKVKHA